MKFSNPKNIALFNALFSTGFFLVIIIIIYFTFPKITVFSIFITALLFFAFNYYLNNYSLEKFIYRKIKVIYKTIHNLKAPKGSKKIEVESDTIENVSQEVEEWGQIQQAEIAKLKELENYRREFLGNVSHELKTPIFNIQGYVLTLLDGGLEDPSINTEYLMRTEKSINRMIAIIEDLEEISILESSQLHLNYTRFNIIELASEVIDFLEIKAKKTKNKVFINNDLDRPITVFADKNRVRHVFANLIENAIKYGLQKKGETKISFFDMDENILIEVTDNGIGILEKYLPRVFERFYRTDKARSREQGGTGLGLAIVKHIIEAHNQTINVRSTPGVGSTFAFTLAKK